MRHGHALSARTRIGRVPTGAFLAPIASRILSGSSLGGSAVGRAAPVVETIRVSRYSEDVYSMGSIARVMVQQLLGAHHSKYAVSEPPDPSRLAGRTVLVLDDASASGGTLRAAHEYCEAAGAKEVHCVARSARVLARAGRAQEAGGTAQPARLHPVGDLLRERSASGPLPYVTSFVPTCTQ